MKDKIIKDWFYFIIGIACLIMSILFYIGKRAWFIVLINILLGVMFLINSVAGKTLGDYLWRRK